MNTDFFQGFERHSVDVGDGVRIHAVAGGQGPPLLLLHGYPQTHVMWHRVAPQLSKHYTLVMPDLRGYGASSKPPSNTSHAPYSKRAMAADMRHLMSSLGFERFAVCGHDRGGRVAHRLALDHESCVSALIVLDIAPTREMYRDADDAFARAYWHWFLLIQPSPFPEDLINSDSDRYFRHKCGQGRAGLSVFDSQAFEAYLAAFRDPETVHATCEDYRAAATIDIDHDNADGDRQLVCPLHVIWGEHGVIEQCFDPVALWQERARSVTGCSIAAGHYLAEEQPEEVVSGILDFLAAHP